MGEDVAREELDRFMAAWMAVRQLVQAANFNRFREAGLSATQFMTLNLLPVEGKGLTVGELATRMNLSPATVVKTLDSLEGRGLLRRARSETDRRLVLVAITPEGAAFQNEAAGRFRESMLKLFAALQPAERSGLIHGLERLVEAGEVNPEERAAAPARHNAPRSQRA